MGVYTLDIGFGLSGKGSYNMSCPASEAWFKDIEGNKHYYTVSSASGSWIWEY